jgi:hypothetical protein
MESILFLYIKIYILFVSEPKIICNLLLSAKFSLNLLWNNHAINEEGFYSFLKEGIFFLKLM